MSDSVPHWTPVEQWTSEQPYRCGVCADTVAGRELGYMPNMCERDGCPGSPGRPDAVEVVPAAALEALRAERDRYREALERAADICEDAATMGCDCDGDYYKCGPCPSAIASRADDAVEVLRAALAAPAPKEDENEC